MWLTGLNSVCWTLIHSPEPKTAFIFHSEIYKILDHQFKSNCRKIQLEILVALFSIRAFERRSSLFSSSLLAFSTLLSRNHRAELSMRTSRSVCGLEAARLCLRSDSTAGEARWRSAGSALPARTVLILHSESDLCESGLLCVHASAVSGFPFPLWSRDCRHGCGVLHSCCPYISSLVSSSVCHSLTFFLSHPHKPVTLCCVGRCECVGVSTSSPQSWRSRPLIGGSQLWFLLCLSVCRRTHNHTVKEVLLPSVCETTLGLNESRQALYKIYHFTPVCVCVCAGPAGAGSPLVCRAGVSAEAVLEEVLRGEQAGFSLGSFQTCCLCVCASTNG